MLYQEASQAYTWGDPLPLPHGKKHPPPAGYTGGAGASVTDVERASWALHDGNLALRLPDGVLGIDVDQYGKKKGLDTMKALADQLGPLPLGWLSTSRDPRSGSGIHLFRYPGGKLAGQVGESVEAIQHGHRYMVVAPSVIPANEEEGQEAREYRWWRWMPELAGMPGQWVAAERPPSLEELPELPEPWFKWLKERAAASAGPAGTSQERDQLLTELVTSEKEPCGALRSLAEAGARKLEEAGDGGRHDAMTGAVLALVSSAAEGHTGFPEALQLLEEAWTEAIGDAAERAGEFERMVATAAAKVAVKYPPAVRAGMLHLCETVRQVPAIHVPEDTTAEAITGPPSLPGYPEVFNPPVLVEKKLATAALGSSFYLHRFAVDENSWYTRNDQEWRWERNSGTPVQGARNILDRLGSTTPEGDPKADKGTPEAFQAARWTMLNKSSTRGSIAQLMVDEAPVIGIKAGDMDADPKVLWAGGYCWDLEASQKRPTLARWVSLTEPHQHSAAVLPKDVPTPRWDAFLEALFPEEVDRDYLMGVLGAATTGVSDRILGVFHGPRKRGKTSVLHLVDKVLGTYAATLDPDLLDPRKGGDFKVMSLKGLRMGWIDEGPSNTHNGQERLKALTGGGGLRGAHKNKDAVAFQATHTLFFTDNRVPEVADPALRDRVRSLEVNGDPEVLKRTVGAMRRDEAEWLATEGPGVLAQLIRWAGLYLEDRSVADAPAHVQAKLEDLGREQDPILSWLEERTDPVGETQVTELYVDFRSHAEASGVVRSTIPNMTVWGRYLNDLGIMPRKSNGVRYRPLTIRRGTIGLGNGTPWAVGATLPSPPQPLPERSLEGGSGTASHGGHDDGQETGRVNPPQKSEPSPDEPPSQDAFRDSREGREGIGLDNQKEEEGEKNAGAAYTREEPSPPDPGAPDPAGQAAPSGTRKKAPAKPSKRMTEEEKAARAEARKEAARQALAEEAMELPALLIRGQEPQAVSWGDACQLLDLLDGNRVDVDVETSGYPVGHPLYVLRTIQLGTPHWVVVLDATEPEHLAKAVEAMDRASELVAHSATADVSLVALAAGVDSDPWWRKTTDTLTLAALSDPAVTGAHGRKDVLGLKSLAAHVLGDQAVIPQANKARAALFTRGKWLTDTEPTTELERSGWANVPSGHPVMVTYAASDVLDTGLLRDKLPMPGPQLLQRERDTQRVLARLPERGLKLDAERVNQLVADHEAQRDTHRSKLADLGVTDPGSNDQVGQALLALGADLPMTAKSQKPSTAAEEVERLAATTGPAQELAQALLDFRHHEKLLSTYLLPAAIQVHRGDGRSRPTILTLGAVATGRMSSARPNIQNVPRPSKVEKAEGGTGGMRGMYVADPGHLFIGADFSSVEVRIAAAVTGDVTLARMIREGVDLHGEVTKLAWGMTEDHPLFQDVRYLAKRAVFLKLYGGGLAAMGNTLGAYRDKAQDVVDALSAVTPGLMEWDRGLRAGVQGGTVTQWTHPSGRVAYFNRDLPHKALNMIVQGYGRELLVDALLRWEAIHPGCTIVPIHDELVIQVPEDQAEAWSADLVECMTTTVGQGSSMVDVVAEADQPSRRWGTVER